MKSINYKFLLILMATISLKGMYGMSSNETPEACSEQICASTTYVPSESHNEGCDGIEFFESLSNQARSWGAYLKHTYFGLFRPNTIDPKRRIKDLMGDKLSKFGRGLALIQQKQWNAKQSLDEEYLAKALSVRDMLLQRYEQGTLSSIAPALNLNNNIKKIDLGIASPGHGYIANINRNKGESIADYGARIYGTTDLRFVFTVSRNLADFAADTADGITTLSVDGKADPIILLNGNTASSREMKTFYTYHELSHAFDACVTKCARNEGEGCYNWLKDDTKEYRAEDVDLGEWHADKQGAIWFREYMPAEAKIYKKELKKKIAAGEERGAVPQYAPYAKLIEWLSIPKDPLRMKEIKRLGLLWNM